VNCRCAPLRAAAPKHIGEENAVDVEARRHSRHNQIVCADLGHVLIEHAIGGGGGGHVQPICILRQLSAADASHASDMQRYAAICNYMQAICKRYATICKRYAAICSYIWPYASGMQLYASDMQLYASDMQLYASDMQRYASDMQLYAGGMQLYAAICS